MVKEGGHKVKEKRNETEQERAAREAKNAYYREWRAKHPDKVKAYNTKYWAGKAKQEQQNGT